MRTMMRHFGKWTAKIDSGGRITICDDWVSNHGIIYPHMIDRFKSYPSLQVIGMDSESGLRKDVLRWIYASIRSGMWDYLIERSNTDDDKIRHRRTPELA